MASNVPKGPKDAELALRQASASPPLAGDQLLQPLPPELKLAGQVQYALVVEVIKDTVPDYESWLVPDGGGENDMQKRKQRRKPRTQRWAPFVFSDDGLTLVDAFPNMVGEAGETKGKGPRTSGRGMPIVKQFPFGRKV
jgi:hypothetical protein